MKRWIAVYGLFCLNLFGHTAVGAKVRTNPQPSTSGASLPPQHGAVWLRPPHAPSPRAGLPPLRAPAPPPADTPGPGCRERERPCELRGRRAESPGRAGSAAGPGRAVTHPRLTRRARAEELPLPPGSAAAGRAHVRGLPAPRRSSHPPALPSSPRPPSLSLPLSLSLPPSLPSSLPACCLPARLPPSPRRLGAEVGRMAANQLR